MKVTYAFAITVSLGTSDKISCPEILCEDPDPMLPLRPDLCFVHDGEQPSEILRAHPCDWYKKNSQSLLPLESKSVCELDVTDGQFAWVNESEQRAPSSAEESQLAHKRTQAFCKDSRTFSGMLNNGRSCQNSYQCKS